MSLFQQNIQTKNQQIHLKVLEEKKVELWIKREDQIHEFVSGNKFRKLKYNITEALQQHKKTILTFGGAFSNHIVATAVASKLAGLKSIGIIRGEELKNNLNKHLQENQTLKIAHENGMQFEFISREDFRNKNNPDFIKYLHQKLDDFYLVPEGGTNPLAIKGCEEILTPQDEKFDYICTAVGTGGTIAGLINTVKSPQKIIGFSALKGEFLINDIHQLSPKKNNWNLQTHYHFGGYAKYNEELIRFINEFTKQTGVLLDPIYTGKMLFGIIDLIQKNQFSKNTKILAIHTGGLQGITGVNSKLKKQNKETIQV